MIARRSFITGLVSLMAAPAIVRAGSLMPETVEMYVGTDCMGLQVGDCVEWVLNNKIFEFTTFNSLTKVGLFTEIPQFRG